MAVKASCTVTLSCYRDTQSVTRYYKLQSSTITAPSKPTANPPSGWSDTEPSYTSGSTNTLYFCDLTVFSDGTWSYSTVSKSSSYEAAKEAYNKAQNAQDAVNSAMLKIDETNGTIKSIASRLSATGGSITTLEQAADSLVLTIEDASKTATNYLKFEADINGLCIGDHTSGSLGRNVLIDTDSVDIRNGTDVLASFSENRVVIGERTANSVISLAKGTGRILALQKLDSSGEQLYPKTLRIDAIDLDMYTTDFFVYTGRDYTENYPLSPEDDPEYDPESPSLGAMDYNGAFGYISSGVSSKYIDSVGETTYGCNTYISANYDQLLGTKASASVTTSAFVKDINVDTTIDGEYIQEPITNTYVYLNAQEWDGSKWTSSSLKISTDLIEADGNIAIQYKDYLKAYDKDGSLINVLQGQNENYNVIIGHGNYTRGKGNVHLYGNDIVLYSAEGGNKSLRPYFRKGDTLTLILRTSGFLTSDKTSVQFTVPLAKPVLGTPTITVSSVSGFILRQNARYTHGSGASTFATPTSYEALNYGENLCLNVNASFTKDASAENNQTIGVYWSGKITFS